MSGDEQVVTAYRLAHTLQVRSDQTVNGVNWRFESYHVDRSQYGVELPGQSWRIFLGGAKAQFGCHDDAGADFRLAHVRNQASNLSLRVFDKVRYNVGIE